MLNKVQLIGRVGKDPEVRYLPSGEAVVNFSIATTEKWKDKNTGEPREETEWHRITAFGKLAEICGEWVTKGMLVYVAGKIRSSKYTDRTSGQERINIDIRIDDMKLLGSRQDAKPQPRVTPPQTAPSRHPAPAKSSFDEMDDDIPF
jgi:single-strand DNA-binding protein